ncbi:MAG: hypothetical protein J6112_05825 [Clostridia bacterium]|nr:hypothetical protein [Clostridia bacterium]
MVTSFIKNHAKIFKFVIIGLICAIMGSVFIDGFVGFFSSGYFFGFVADLLYLCVFLGLLALLLITFIMGKHAPAKVIGIMLLSFWVVTELLSIGNPLYSFRSGATFMDVIIALCLFAALLTILGIFVLYVLKAVFSLKVDLIIEILLIVLLAAMASVFLLKIIADLIYAKGFNLFGYMSSYLFIPALAVIGYVYLAPEKIAKE